MCSSDCFSGKQQIFIERLLYSPSRALPTRSKYNNSCCSFPPFLFPLISVALPWYTVERASHHFRGSTGIKTQKKIPSKVESWCHWKVLISYAGCQGPRHQSQGQG